MNYYNDHDKGAAAWLRELIKAGHIPPGIVDERSITEVKKEDLAGFTQCHFFCGIGGWPFALHLAGIPSTVPLWTGSPPCQPFSVAGKQLGKDDPRHLAPAFLELVAQCRPPVLFGEQVAAAIGKHWLDALLIELEEQGYTCGAAVLPACSVGAPHKRERLFFGAFQLADNDSRGCWQGGESGAVDAVPQHGKNNVLPSSERSSYSSVADTDGERLQRQRPDGDTQGRKGSDVRQAGLCDGAGFSAVDDSDNQHQCATRYKAGSGIAHRASDTLTPAPPHHGFWSDADWLGCRDGKFRPVEPGTFPLAYGVPSRVGRLRGYGNAIAPQVAAEFIKAFTGAINDVN